MPVSHIGIVCANGSQQGGVACHCQMSSVPQRAGINPRVREVRQTRPAAAGVRSCSNFNVNARSKDSYRLCLDSRWCVRKHLVLRYSSMGGGADGMQSIVMCWES
jgi:hypothetical protein